ncbi:hypothetical protein BH18ACI1_BH18ACI1_10240 [soil metagenome]|jgi:hypothetical protein|nr:hypothetical protein [Acidobacteriota bacterium]
MGETATASVLNVHRRGSNMDLKKHIQKELSSLSHILKTKIRGEIMEKCRMKYEKIKHITARDVFFTRFPKTGFCG